MLGRIRYALRSLKTAPLLSLVVILSLGLGIGANTAIFSLLHQVLLSSLAVPHPEQLVLLTSPGDLKKGLVSDDESGNSDYTFNWRTMRDLEKLTEPATVAGFRRFGSNISFARQTFAGSMMLVSGRYFDVMGTQPLFGRLIGPEDDIPGSGNPVAVLTYRYWHDKLGAETGVLNQTVKVNGQPFTVVGVAPPQFTGTTVGSMPSLFLPMSSKPRVTGDWDGTDKLTEYWIYLLARLKPGVTLQQAETAMNGPYRAMVEEMAQQAQTPVEKTARFRNQKLTLQNGRQGHSDYREQYRPALKVLFLATGLVLLIAIANAANLLLARSVERRQELAIRAALGAGRGELMWQFLTEALLLSAAGGVAGMAIAVATIRLLLATWTANPHNSFASEGLNLPVLAFGIALSLITGVLFGLYPAWDAARLTLATRLNDASAKTSSSRGAARLRKGLVCAQLAIAIILLIPTGLFVRSLVNLLHVNLGIRTAGIIGFRITPEENGYTPAQSRAVFERAEAELAAIPGVRSVGTSLVPLIGNSNWGTGIRLEGSNPGDRPLNSKFNEVGPGFLGKAGIPLIAGREIGETDTAVSPKVIVVNEAFAKKFFEGRNPIGHRVGFGKKRDLDTEIVGLVKDSHYSSVRMEPPPLFFRPWRQDQKVGALSFYVRTELPPGQIVPQIRTVMRRIDADVPVEDMRTLNEQVHFNIQADEFTLRLASAFALLATVLAMLGLYGVMANGVARRTREIGIRMALGAAPGRIRLLVLRDLVWILGFGLAAGVPVALASTKLIESRLFGVKGGDVTIVAGATLLLAATAVAAAYWPARRASRVNPLEALRYE